MTHEELYTKIRTGNEFLGIKYAPDSHTFALRRVVELHSPEGRPEQQCQHCKKIYPCPTIQAITKELPNG